MDDFNTNIGLFTFYLSNIHGRGQVVCGGWGINSLRYYISTQVTKLFISEKVNRKRKRYQNTIKEKCLLLMRNKIDVNFTKKRRVRELSHERSDCKFRK